ncbi:MULTISPECIES: ABC transporter substrate-binding protein [Micromonospora]|uniref:ABC transporter substrate-binding protein n=1 Tax=Micromonospora solifontis TaxID=2487138 RepID=A0ABX9WI79_9ACTN|nr:MULTISPECIES: ABC transporter substrate-binding protein [Micromonospora]NES16380.1 ABC transporter substrate-binding protein [Micromonospora sp. PPF5-17B]NES36230.1 ABC transporter substrate-binding protein [Micromonospora solifontis]NES57981.1 ABC transporter substrate-binding protein [Micromonospora sp. PPF5-6]RNL99818.1 ABC transporter substrate-binding protein [Micromonospora solifontis]
MSQMNRRRALQLLAALGTSGLAAGCGSDTDSEDTASAESPVKIGLIVPSVGPNKAIGDEITNGFQLFLSLNNQQLGGHPVTVVQAEEGDSPKTGQAAVDRLVKEDVLALTGVVSPTVMSGIRDTVEQARVPLIGSNASPASLQSVVYIWRTSYVLDEPGEALGGYLRQMGVSGRIAIFAPQGVGSRDVIDGFRRGYEQEGRRLTEDPVLTTDNANPGKAAFSGAITKALGKRPDAVFCNYTGTAAVQFIKQLYDQGYEGKVYAPGFLTEGTVLSQLDDGENGEQRTRILKQGIETALNYSPDLNNNANRVFASAYRKTYGASPTTYAMASYDAAQVLDKAIRLVGASPTPQAVNLALGKIGQIDSPRGAWQFNQPRTPQQKWYLRRVMLDGRLLSNVVVNELATLG